MGFAELLEEAREARKMAFSFSNPLIVHHYDADGISGGAIVKKAFLENSKPCRMMWLKKIDEEAIARLRNEKEIIFVDLGNSEGVEELQDVLILDHHQIKNSPHFQINPLIYGIDGGSELSSAGVASLVFDNSEDLAIVGMVGDMQYPINGVGRKILKKAIEKKLINLSIDLTFYGKQSRPLIQFLAYNDEPYIPSITYREDKAEQLLQFLNIPLKEEERWRTYSDLSFEEKKALISTLVEILLSFDKPYSIVGENYELLRYPSNFRYASEFSTLLNACGRHNKAEIGIAVALGDKKAEREGQELLEYHKRKIREAIAYAQQNLVDLGCFLLIDGRGVIDEGIIGIVCGMVMQSKKPVVGISNSDKETIKVSIRIPKRLPFNAGKILSSSSSKVGGAGGGHKVAAGASIPAEKLNDFLLEIGKMFKSSIDEVKTKNI